MNKLKNQSHIPPFDIAIVGGAGHIGLPLALAFANKALRVLIYDINTRSLDLIKNGTMPFMEEGAEAVLNQALTSNHLAASSNLSDITDIPVVIITIGTPVDGFVESAYTMIGQCVEELLPHLTDDQLLILRSTVYPGTTAWLHNFLQERDRHNLLAFCPERIVQGHAIRELHELPQIVSGVTPDAEAEAAKLFAQIAPEIICLNPTEAEFAKLFNNAYRYVLFAMANQFYTIAEQAGVDYYRVLDAMKWNYPRAHDIPRAGFAAGPCLLKDTVHLTNASNGRFSLLQSAIQVNEGMVDYLVDRVAKQVDLVNATIGLLGMAFKADCDDTRNSLSYPLKQRLQMRAKRVLTTDPHVPLHVDPDLQPLGKVLEESDILILCVPHRAYQGIKVDSQRIIDIWDFL